MMKRYDMNVFGIRARLEIPKETLKEYLLDGNENIQKYLEELITGLDMNPKFSLETTGSMAILNSHSLYNLPGWNYLEKMTRRGPKVRRVQKWIDEHDGQSEILFVCSCNPHREQSLKSNESILIYPSGDIIPKPDLKMYDPEFLVRHDPKGYVA